MGLAVVTVPSGGLPVVDVTSIAPLRGVPVSEAANGYGIAVTKVVGKLGMPVLYTAAAAFVPATLNGVATGVTVSNGGLTATYNGGGGSTNGARSASVVALGDFYFEVNVVLMRNTDAIGILLSTGTYFNLLNDGTNCATVYGTGAIWSNNVNTGKSIGSFSGSPHLVGVAIKLAARLAFFRRDGGAWNGDGAANPTTGVGGVAIAASGSFGPAIGFNGAPGDNATANFGQSTFAFPAPSSFTPGWSA